MPVAKTAHKFLRRAMPFPASAAACTCQPTNLTYSLQRSLESNAETTIQYTTILGPEIYPGTSLQPNLLRGSWEIKYIASL
jgi:hypothetical protein